MQRIKIKIETLSNLFIGGLPHTFEIGGVDQYTITDYKASPIIPASSWKGALRSIIRDMEREKESGALRIKEGYQNYLQELKKQNQEKEILSKIKAESVNNLKNRMDRAIEHVSAEYLFGVQGFNLVPKLIFNDFHLKSHTSDWYSIDIKNSIEQREDKVISNPRSYKTVRPGMVFNGEILLWDIEKLGIEGVKEFVESAILKFNDGRYRLGNSGSRGYGRVEIKIESECD
jgi:Uncharacterized protein predicted to be involved in DNA repair (RAMP superfamily)